MSRHSHLESMVHSKNSTKVKALSLECKDGSIDPDQLIKYTISAKREI